MPSERIELSGCLKYIGVSICQSNKTQPTGWEALFKSVIGGKRRGVVRVDIIFAVTNERKHLLYMHGFRSCRSA